VRRGLALLLLSVAACVPQEAYPTSAQVDAFEEPRGQEAFVIVFEPLSEKGSLPIVSRDAEVLRHVDGVRVACVNMACESHSGIAVLSKPPPGVDHVELKVEKDGFEPVTITIPFRDGAAPYPHFVVLLRRAGAR
jgi:hypothetical protein